MPFPLLLPLIMGASSIFSGLGAGRSQERQSQNAATSNSNDALARMFGTQQAGASNAYNTQQQAILQALGLQSREGLDLGDLDLRQRQFALDAPTTRGRQALTGSLLQRLQPVTMSGLPSRISSRMPTISGGLSPAAIGPLARQMGLLMQQNAVSGQRRGDQFATPQRTNFTGGVLNGGNSLLTPPTMQGYQQPGRAESLLGMLGMIGPAISGFQAARGPGQPSAMPGQGQTIYSPTIPGSQFSYRQPPSPLRG